MIKISKEDKLEFINEVFFSYYITYLLRLIMSKYVRLEYWNFDFLRTLLQFGTNYSSCCVATIILTNFNRSIFSNKANKNNLADCIIPFNLDVIQDFFLPHLTTVKSGLGQDYLIKISVPVNKKVIPFF